MEEGWFSDGETQAQRHKGAMAQGQSDWATKQLSEGAIERQEVRGFGSPFEGGQGDVGRAHSSETEVPLLEGTRRTTHHARQKGRDLIPPLKGARGMLAGHIVQRLRFPSWRAHDARRTTKRQEVRD